MSATLGNIGYGAIFYTGDTSSPPAYTAVLEIKSIKKKNLTVPVVDFSHLLSPNRTAEKGPGIIEPGDIELGGNFIGDATQLGIQTLAQAGTVFPFKITAPVQKGAKTYTAIGLCFVTEYGPADAFEADKPMQFMAKFQISGAVTETVV